MAHYIILAWAALLVVEFSGTEALLENTSDCCGRMNKMNATCLNSTQCDSACLHAPDNSTVVCIHCDPENLTVCNYTKTNHNSISTIVKIGGPGVAASVLLGTLLISLFLILSVASFFYLKRSSRLPGVFYRRNKAFIFQPSETAVMIPAATSSVRKPRYVRRERPLATSASNSAAMATGPVTKVYNV